MKKLTITMMAGLILLAGGIFDRVMAEGWTMELTPYVWMPGIDADVTVGDRSGSIDVGFDDLVDYVDVAGGLLLTVEKDRWVTWFQGDYMDLESDKKATDFDALGTLELQMTILEAGFGRQFNNPLSRKGHLDLLIGVRYTDIETTFDAASGASFERDKDYFDPMLIMRPWFPITQKLAFNPTLAIGGGGDSDLIYELQPQLRYNFTETVSMSVGYRRLYYDVDGDRAEFDGALHGALVGFGFKF